MQKEVKNKRPELRVRYSPEEFVLLKKGFIRSACGTIGAYARKMSLGQPIEVVTRNASFDAFVEEMMLVRKEMAAIRQHETLSPENQQVLIGLQQKIQGNTNKIVQLCMHPFISTPASTTC